MRDNTMAEALTDEQVVEIRRLYHVDGWTQGRLARQFKRAVGTIGRIVRGETHQDVGMPRAIPEDEVAASQKKLEELLQAKDESKFVDPLKEDKPKPYA